MSLSAHVVVIKNGAVLLIQHEDFKMWVLPGGHVEAGESVAQAAVREVYEEGGIEVVLISLVGIYAMPHWIGDVHNVVFAATLVASCSPSQERLMMPTIFMPISCLSACPGGIASQSVTRWLALAVALSGSRMYIGL